MTNTDNSLGIEFALGYSRSIMITESTTTIIIGTLGYGSK